MRISKFLAPLTGAALAIASFASLATTAEAGRYSENPPIVLSPGLTTPWVLQLQGEGAGLHHSTQAQPKRHVAKRQPKRSTRQVIRAKRTAKRSIGAEFLPATVAYESRHKPGTIVIDTKSHYLYLIKGNGQARRYGVGVGKAGFEWSGTEKISRKRKWPGWTPPAQMIAREKKKGRILPKHMPGGPENPLGARALYLGSTLYRIHGTNQPWTIGKSLSSGCIRMRNQDVTALYEQVRVGARVIVR